MMSGAVFFAQSSWNKAELWAVPGVVFQQKAVSNKLVVICYVDYY